MDFAYFCGLDQAKLCNLEPPHVLALRLYSTACYKSINMPLRDTSRQTSHPLAVLVSFVDEGVRRLRAVGAKSRDSSVAKRCRALHQRASHAPPLPLATRIACRRCPHRAKPRGG